jgi:hypothetical protein
VAVTDRDLKVSAIRRYVGDSVAIVGTDVSPERGILRGGDRVGHRLPSATRSGH